MLKTVHRYKVLDARSCDKLEAAVNFHINSGWVLVGGLAYSDTHGEYFQAVSYTAEEDIPTHDEKAKA